MINKRGLSLSVKISSYYPNWKIWFKPIVFTMLMLLVGCSNKPLTLNTPKADFRNAKAADQIKVSDTINSEILTALKEIKAFENLETVQILNSLKSLVNEASVVRFGTITVNSEISLVKGGNVVGTLNLQFGAKVPANTIWDSVEVVSKGMTYKHESISPQVKEKERKGGIMKYIIGLFGFIGSIFVFLKSLNHQPVEGSTSANLTNFITTFFKRR